MENFLFNIHKTGFLASYLLGLYPKEFSRNLNAILSILQDDFFKATCMIWSLIPFQYSFLLHILILNLDTNSKHLNIALIVHKFFTEPSLTSIVSSTNYSSLYFPLDILYILDNLLPCFLFLLHPMLLWKTRMVIMDHLASRLY